MSDDKSSKLNCYNANMELLKIKISQLRWFNYLTQRNMNGSNKKPGQKGTTFFPWCKKGIEV